MGRRGSRRRQLLDVLKGKTGYWKLKDEAIDLTMWRSRFGKKKCISLLKQPNWPQQIHTLKTSLRQVPVKKKCIS